MVKSHGSADGICCVWSRNCSRNGGHGGLGGGEPVWSGGGTTDCRFGAVGEQDSQNTTKRQGAPSARQNGLVWLKTPVTMESESICLISLLGQFA